MTARSEVGIDLVARNMASREIAAVGGNLDNLDESARRSGGGLRMLGSAGASLVQGIFLGAGLLAVQTFTQTVSAVPNAVIGMNASLEKSQIQFTTLFGDADRAREHVRMLFEFAKTTPFETQPVIDASRTLQTFGGDALNTSEKLTLVGDAAAGASVNINEVAFWVGRAYAAIQGGQPFGEARMRLQELALLSPTAAAEMERLQKAGASTTEVWQVLEGELGRFSGAMNAQAQTWEGLSSTLADTFNLTLADAFKPFFEMAKSGLTGLIEIMSSEGFQNGLREFAAGAIEAFKAFGNVVGAVLPYFVTLLKAVATAIGVIIGVVQGVVAFIDRFKTGITIISAVIAGLFIPTLVAWAAAQLAALAPWLLIGAAIVAVTAVIVVVVDTIANFVGWLFNLAMSIEPVRIGFELLILPIKLAFDAIMAIVGAVKTVLEFFGILKKETADTAASVGESMNDMSKQAGKAADDVATTPSTIATGLEAGKPLVADAAHDALGRPIVQGVRAGSNAAEEIAKQTPQDIAKSLRDGRNSVKTAGDFLKDAIKDAISPAKEIAKLEAQLTGTRMTEGLNSKNAEVRAAAVAWKTTIEDRLFALKNGVPDIALDTGLNYADALEQAKTDARNAALANTREVDRAMIAEAKAAGPHGRNTGYAYSSALADGLRNGMPLIRAAMAAVKQVFEAGSPPKRGAALYGIERWGEASAEAFIGPFVGQFREAATELRAAVTGFARPIVQGPSLAPVAPAVAFAGAGTTVYQEFHFGRDSVRSDDDIRRMGIEMQERAQLQGFTATNREVGRVVVV